MSNLGSVMSECEEHGEFERSAALALWYGDIEAAVDALQRGTLKQGNTTAYDEVVELVSFSIAGYRGGETNPSLSTVWRKACEKLLHRADLSDPAVLSGGQTYLRHILKFLMTIGTPDMHNEIMDDSTLSLCDRVAFGCRFLAETNLKRFLDESVVHCINAGNLEGIAITGMEKQGIQILQSYVDHSADVQTAALVTSRVILPGDWVAERRIAAEWLHSYRSLLNRWQMWQSRATFDVDRADVLRGVKMRLASDVPGNVNGQQNGRRSVSVGRRPGGRSLDPDVQAAVPAQLEARCNYCSASLVLRKRQETQPNQWLSKMKGVLQCCPQCRKPLPRCAVCMLSLGTLNPYMELTRERPRIGPRGQYPATPTALSSSQSAAFSDDLSSLANLPFAEWFSWCLRCKHGGHAHHMVGWFAKHEVCPVSGCHCRCQFDGINKLQRPMAPSMPLEPTAT
jgi:WD repeat-containing protein mio